MLDDAGDRAEVGGDARAVASDRQTQRLLLGNRRVALADAGLVGPGGIIINVGDAAGDQKRRNQETGQKSVGLHWPRAPARSMPAESGPDAAPAGPALPELSRNRRYSTTRYGRVLATGPSFLRLLLPVFIVDGHYRTAISVSLAHRQQISVMVDRVALAYSIA
jgi:hypothetical protein